MKEFLSQFGIVEEKVDLETLNTYRIKTQTKYLLHPCNEEDVQKFVNYAKKKHLSYFVLGNGSNVILSDTMYDGVIVKLDQMRQIEYQENEVTVGAGVMLNFLARDCLEHGLCGLEWASGIPGTVGGAIFGNAEAYKTATFTYLKSVRYLTPDGVIKTSPKEELSHDYRTSFFKENPGHIILEAVFCLPIGDKKKSLELIADRLQRRLASQPLEYPSAGSVFRNPSPTLPSGKLIDELGLKGTRIGDAMVSVKHANFIINLGNATGKDIRSLIQLVHDKVEEAYHIDLILEQEYKDW